RRVARELNSRIRRLPQVKDTYMPQGMDLPQLRIDVDRTRASWIGLTETDVIRNVITSLMSSAQIAPNFWIDPRSGNPYYIGVQYPAHLVQDITTLENIPLGGDKARQGMGVHLLKEVAKIVRIQGPVEVYRHNADRVSQLFVTVNGNDLATAALEVE